MHSEQATGANERALEDFRAGAVDVLVNVEMVTHGIDVPDAKSVFLCRPTTSDILFAQMVGRAARRDAASGKTSFFVVEFTDNVEEHGELFQTPQLIFTGATFAGRASAGAEATACPPRAAREHNFDPRGAPTWIPHDEDVPETIRGLWYRQAQTFGIEFELTSLNGHVPALDGAWLEAAEALRARLASALPGRVASQVTPGYAGSNGQKDCSRWNIEYDGSAGWEVTSRILVDREGFAEVDAACRTLDAVAADLGMRVSHRTGTHVHMGWLGRDADEVKRAIRLTRLFEPALATLVAPSRVVHFERGRYNVRAPNPYCRPVSSVFSERVLRNARTLDDLRAVAERDDARYVTFNVRPLSQIHTVEIRLHNGTLEARKILLWVSLWQQLLWAAAHRDDVPAVPDTEVIFPDGDIVQLALEHLPDPHQPQQRLLVRRLAARRAEIRDDQWTRVPELASWVASTTAWVHPP